MRIAKGERFRVVQPLKRAALVYFSAPFTGGFECTLATGTVLAAAQDSGPDKNTVLLVPEEKEPFERTWLTEERNDLQIPRVRVSFPEVRHRKASSLASITHHRQLRAALESHVSRTTVATSP